MQQKIWFTPDGIEDLVPEQARKLEYYRRELVDGFQASGYDLILTPIAEFTDSLLTGTGRHLAIDTCRFADQESGRMMGIRADMTPQVARFVTTRCKDEDIVRLCYVGEVLKTRNNKAKGSRSPFQVGAELFGHGGVESDIEVIALMLSSLRAVGLNDFTLSLGHVSIVEELMDLAELSDSQKRRLVDILDRKAIPEYEEFVRSLTLPSLLASAFTRLPELCGNANDVLTDARNILSVVSSGLDAYLQRLQRVVDYFQVASENLHIHVDLADMRGYDYHTGIIFTCYANSRKLYMIAKGGRYDGIGSDFGAFKPATGFSMDLRNALDLLPAPPQPDKEVVYAPVIADPVLVAKITELKRTYVVKRFYQLSEVPAGSQFLEKDNDAWSLSNK